MNFSNLIIGESQNILKALHRLSNIKEFSRLILFVETKEGKIIGSLTDGDIRRSLSQDEDLYKLVRDVCNKNFTFINKSTDYQHLNSFRKKGLKILPVLNNDLTLHKIIDLEETFSILPLECMIMAGGRGKRLSPLTDSVPKPMLPLGGIPIIEHNINRLIAYGIKKIYISVKYLGEQIETYFGDGSSRGVKIEYIWEDKALGTAGALALVANYDTEHILLMNSDLFTNVNFEEMYLNLINEKAEMVVASTEYKIDVPYAVFESKGDVVKAFKEKPSYVYHSNAGIYIFKRELINKIPKGEFYDITDLMDNLVKEGKKLIHDPIRGYWIDIGQPIDYKNAKDFIKHLS